jgi:hypothetical protein
VGDVAELFANSLCAQNNGCVKKKKPASKIKQQFLMFLLDVGMDLRSFLVRYIMTVTLFFHHERCNTTNCCSETPQEEEVSW